MKISRLSPNEWKKYRDLRLESLEDVPQAFLSTVEETKKTAPEEWQRKIKNMFFAVDDDDQIVGMIGGFSPDKDKTKHTFKVVSFYVSPQYRGQGVGEKLLTAILDYARNLSEITKIELSVATTQEAAIELYQEAGFKKIGRQQRAIKIDDQYYDEDLMELVL